MAHPRRLSGLLLAFIVLSISMTFPATAGATLLDYNSGTENIPWFIEGEPSLVMNGFDLNTPGITTPAQLDAVSISVLETVPGVPVDVYVYQDISGGSPVDAALAGRTRVTINTPGVTRVVFPQPVTITAPVVWVGFYLPVGFSFAGDASGTQGITWWAWQPTGTFDATSLRNAAVLGPADGSAPVALDMGGVARITAEITGSAPTIQPTQAFPNAPLVDFNPAGVATDPRIPAGSSLLSINAGVGAEPFFIEGEPSLVMNGFNLNTLGVETPVQINGVNISVVESVPGVPVDVVIYADTTGGSPADAVLVSRTQVFISGNGVRRVVFSQPVTVNAPVVWAGFYLPTGFSFAADTSGANNLTWWAWQPGGTFNINALATAPVLGPANGSAPVGIDMAGVARIALEIDAGDQPVQFIDVDPVLNTAGSRTGFTGVGTNLMSVNAGDGVSEFFIDGEPSLVMNGFDLVNLGYGSRILLNTIDIALTEVIPGVPIEAVIYEDPTGGSPADATLIARSQTIVNTPGVVRVGFPNPVEINSPQIWVGFNLPVGFSFAADTSGTNFLTWWAWQPGSSFDLSSPGNAGVLGAGDGSAPVNIDMGGVARITAGITPLTSGAPVSGLPPVNVTQGPIFIDRPLQNAALQNAAAAVPQDTGRRALSNNSGGQVAEFFVDNEPSMILNGFDLNSLDIERPLRLEAVSLSVLEPIPGVPIEVVAYEDSNGGSPADATLIGRTQLFVSNPGQARAVFTEPVEINAPVLWVGFYLPVGFRFAADTSGSSVLTWWAWQPQSVFDVNSLANAGVLGPADGTDPVGIDLGGIAYITAEVSPVPRLIITDTGTDQQGNVLIGVQAQGDPETPLNTLQNYPYCGESLFYDPEDFNASGGAFTLVCRADVLQNAAGSFVNINDTPSGIVSFERRGYLFDIKAWGDYRRPGSFFNSELRTPITHCIRPEQIDLERAVIGIRFNNPNNWKILPTVRFNEIICAEVEHEGLLTYFVPRDGTEQTINADLFFSGPLRKSSESPFCNEQIDVTWAVKNEGFVTIPSATVRIRDFHLRTGTVSNTVDVPIGPLEPGETFNSNYLWRVPDLFLNELHRVELIIDPENQLAELNEGNNIISQEYILQPQQDGSCD